MELKNGEYDVDEYGTVLPTTDSAMVVARHAIEGGTIIDLKLGEGTSMNVLFVVAKNGKPKDSYKVKDLNVAIDRTGYFQFSIPRNGTPLAWTYVNEKLGLGMEDAVIMANFITEVSDFIIAIQKIKSGELMI